MPLVLLNVQPLKLRTHPPPRAYSLRFESTGVTPLLGRLGYGKASKINPDALPIAPIAFRSSAAAAAAADASASAI